MCIRDSYKGPDKPRNGGIDFVLYSSLDTAYTDLTSGNLDVTDTVPVSALNSYKKALGKHALTIPTASNQQISIAYYLPHFSAGREGQLRRAALSMAINRPEVTKVVFRGARTPSRDFTARSLPGWNGDIPGSDVLDYNPAKAKQLWQEANAISPWSGSFQIAYNSDGDHQVWVDAVCNQIKNTLGIDSHGAPQPTFKQIRSAITSKAIKTAARTGWQGDYPSMLEFLAPIFVSGAGSNDAQYVSPEFDAQLTAAQRARTDDESYRLTNVAQETLLKDLPNIPLWDYIGAGGSASEVTAQLAWNGLPDYPNITKEAKE